MLWLRLLWICLLWICLLRLPRFLVSGLPSSSMSVFRLLWLRLLWIHLWLLFIVVLAHPNELHLSLATSLLCQAAKRRRNTGRTSYLIVTIPTLIEE
jgi:hypothetical protein